MFSTRNISRIPNHLEGQLESEYQWPFAGKSLKAHRILDPSICVSAYPDVEGLTRSQFQKDIVRIVNSLAYTKLERKTQIFISPATDYFVSRHIHSIQVATIAQAIARRLLLCEDLVTAIALGHDLGHTPFGHNGEEVLNRIMGIFSKGGFRHDVQSKRIITELAHQCLLIRPNASRPRQVYGLNLTKETIDGIANHTTYYKSTEKKTDFEVLNSVPITLEGQVVRLADNMAYLNHDINDAIYAGILRDKGALVELKKRTGFSRDIHSRLKEMIDDCFRATIPELRRFYKKNCDGCIRNHPNSRTYCVYSCDSLKRFVRAGETAKRGVVGFSADMERRADELWKFIQEHIHMNDSVKRRNEEAKNYITKLFYYYWSNPMRLPAKTIQKFKKNRIDKSFFLDGRFLKFQELIWRSLENKDGDTLLRWIEESVDTDKTLLKSINLSCLDHILSDIKANLKGKAIEVPADRIFFFELLYKYPRLIESDDILNNKNEFKKSGVIISLGKNTPRCKQWKKGEIPSFDAQYMKYKRLVCDFMAGMTDRYALNAYEDILAPSWSYRRYFRQT